MSTLPRPKRQGMLASLGIPSMSRKNSSNVLNGNAGKDEKKAKKGGKVEKSDKNGSRAGWKEGNENDGDGEGEGDASFVVVDEQRPPHLDLSSSITTKTPTPLISPSTETQSQESKSPLHPSEASGNQGQKRMVTAPIAYQTLAPSSPSSAPNSLLGSPARSTFLPNDTHKDKDPSTSGIPKLGLGRPKSALPLYNPHSSPGKNIEGMRNLTAPVEPGLVRRRSMLWDNPKTTPAGLTSPEGNKKGGMGMTRPGEGRASLRHKRSVSAIVSLNPPVASMAVGGSVSVRGKKADEEKSKIGTGTGTGMSLRPRTTTKEKEDLVPGTRTKAPSVKEKVEVEVSKRSSTPVTLLGKEPVGGNRLSKRASQMMLPPTQTQARSQTQSKTQTRPPPEPVRRSVRLGHAKEPSPTTTTTTEDERDTSVAEVRASKRRSMLPLNFVQVETSGGEEVLKASGSEEVLTTAKNAEGEVETNRQDALDRLMGAGTRSVSGSVGTGSVRGKTMVTTSTITSPRTIATTRTATPARGQPVTTRRAATPTGMKTLGAVQSRAKGDQPPPAFLTKAGSTMRNSTRVVSNVNAGVVKLRDAGKIPKLTMTPDTADRRDPVAGRDPVDATIVGGADRGSSTLISANSSASPVSHQTPRSKLLLSPGSAPSTSTKTSPSSRDPLTRLRGTPATGKDSPRSRKSSNNSDIGVMMEQSRRTWMRGPGGEGDSPLTGRISELKGDSPKSSRVKRVVGRASSGVNGANKSAADVFGTDKGTSAKIAALEAQLKAMQEASERERTEQEKRMNEAREREAVKQMLMAVKNACENELEMLERRRVEKERMVDAFDRAVGMVVSTL